mgnify:FL=1
MAETRFYWLNLPTDFLDSKVIKKLRRMAGGDTYTIIALKILLKGATEDNRLYYEGVEESFAKELASTLDESDIDTEITVSILLNCGWLVKESEDCYLVSKATEMTGSETSQARRMRKLRNKKQFLLTEKDTEEIEEVERHNVRKCDADVRKCDANLENDLFDDISTKNENEQFVILKEDTEKERHNVRKCDADVTLKEKEKDEKKKENTRESMSSSLRSEEHTKEVCEKSDEILEKAPRNRDVAKVLPEWLKEHGVEGGEELHDVLDAFAEMRVRIRKPLTARAVKLNLNEAWKLSNGSIATMVQIFDQSISNSWCGVFALRENLLTKPFPVQLRGGQAGFSTGVYEQMKDEEVPF